MALVSTASVTEASLENIYNLQRNLQDQLHLQDQHTPHTPVLIHCTISLGVRMGGRSRGAGSWVNHSRASSAFSRMWALNTAQTNKGTAWLSTAPPGSTHREVSSLQPALMFVTTHEASAWGSVSMHDATI